MSLTMATPTKPPNARPGRRGEMERTDPRTLTHELTTIADECPMSVAHFLAHAEQYLRRGDVVLCKGKATLFSWAIRWWTNSHFSHAALVFAVPSQEEGFERTFLIEAGTSGVD